MDCDGKWIRVPSAIERVALVVLDSVGIGDAPDADAYGDAGSNTLGNTARAVGGLSLPNLQAMGLGNLTRIEGVPPTDAATAAFGRMQERSAGKDTTTGHWELAGLWLDKPFPTYPQGFPPEVIRPFEEAVGRPVLGNKAASGTEIIAELGEEHLRTGRPIVYTSADSVFQIAAHEKVIPRAQLYQMCRIARELLTGDHAVARVIARPFIGEPGAFVRTDGRRDFSLPPPEPTLLDQAMKQGVDVVAVGKVNDIFAGRGVSRAIPTADNMETVTETVGALRSSKPPALIFANCVDFDAKFGHRNDPVGYARALEEFDARVPELVRALGPRDVLILVADHGCDPTTPSTDHSRELVPLLVHGPPVRPNVDLGTRATFADVAATIASALALAPPRRGTSFWSAIAAL